MYHRHDEKELNWEPGGVRSGAGVRRSGVSASSETWEAALCRLWRRRQSAAVHLQDMDVVGEPVQQRAGEAFRSEHLGPLVERQVGGDQDGAALVALPEDLEEQFRSGGGQGDEAQFVDDQQAEAGQIPLQVEPPPLVPGFQRSALPRRHGRDAPARFPSRCTSLP